MPRAQDTEMAEDTPVLVPHTNCVCLEITLPEHFSRQADKLFVIPSHSREPLSHPPAQLNSESSWVSLTFFISRKSIWNWEELPIQLVESNCHFQQLGSFLVAAEPHSWAGRKAQPSLWSSGETSCFPQHLDPWLAGSWDPSCPSGR